MTPGGIAVAARLLHYTILVIGVLVALQTAGIKLTAVLTAGAAFAVGFGLAIQGLAQNIVSGVLLLLERSIKPGDIVEVDGDFVRVELMGIRATIVRTLDDEELIIPNSNLVQSTVKNYTLTDSQYRLRVGVGVSYGSDMDLVRRVLEEVATECAFRLRQRPILVLLTGFGSSSVDWEVGVWVDQPWLHRRFESDLREQIWRAFAAHHIVIAFPQLDVHLDPGVLLAVQRGATER